MPKRNVSGIADGGGGQSLDKQSSYDIVPKKGLNVEPAKSKVKTSEGEEEYDEEEYDEEEYEGEEVIPTDSRLPYLLNEISTTSLNEISDTSLLNWIVTLSPTTSYWLAQGRGVETLCREYFLKDHV